MPALPTLPSRLSDLIRVAVEDARLLEHDPRYKLDMNVWHEPFEEGRCRVCMAGAVMVRQLSLPIDLMAYPSVGRFHPADENRLHALNSIREGNVWQAWRKLNFVWQNLVWNSTENEAVDKSSKRIRADFDRDLQRAPWETYLAVAAQLAEVGL